ncbi:MAG: C_GCAxxG_C_C family protein [Desulfosarcina sp.]|nr:C_GCAxxG_C_C family protein [Desulfobacterales bacterium]
MGRPNDELEELIRRKVENLFATRQLQCAEAVLCVLNRGFGGELTDALAVRLASGFPEGLGNSGCLCGALSGAVLAMGLFLGRSGPGLGNGHLVKQAVAELQQTFKARYKSTCCRILTRNLDYGSQAHFRHCARVSGEAAQIATHILLQVKTDLTDTVDWTYLGHSDSGLGAGFKILSGTWRCANGSQ